MSEESDYIEDQDDLEAEEEELQEEDEEEGAEQASSSRVFLQNKVEIFPDQRLKGLDIGPLKAYAAKGKKILAGDFVALVCDPLYAPRIKTSEIYTIFSNSHLADLAARGVVYWPPANEERYVLIYRNNFGQKLLQEGERPALGWKQEQVMSSVLEPMLRILQDFREKDFVHGSIRPSNMYDGGGKGEAVHLILGDCVGLPCSYSQPAIYETITRCMADPLGRGIGTREDDLYALGVSIAVLMRTTDPLEGLDREEIVRKKIELGSYAAITGKDRFKGSVLELLRGLLNDDPVSRWNLDEIESWMEGNRISPKQVPKRIKAPRPFVFDGKKYFFLPLLAMHVCRNPSETKRVVESSDLQQWILRSLEDEETAEIVEKAIPQAQKDGREGDYVDRLASHVSFALDASAPFRYQNWSFRPDAIGHYLAQAMIKNQDVNAFANLLSKSTIINWISRSVDPSIDRVGLISRFDSCRNYLKQKKIGYGIERCLYTLSPNVHCLSEKLKGYVVRSSEDMIVAFEKICEKGAEPDFFLDRHSVAFLAAREQRTIEGSLYDLASDQQHKRIAANLVCFALAQKRANIKALPALGQSFMKQMPLILEHFHDREMRKVLEKEIGKYAKEGNLYKMAELIANPETFNRDLHTFKYAMVEYKRLKQDLETLDKKLEDKNNYGKKAAGEVAAFVSVLLSGIIITLLTVMFLSGQSLF